MSKKLFKQAKLVLHNLTLDDIEKYKVIIIFNCIKTFGITGGFEHLMNVFIILLLLLLLLLLPFERQSFKINQI